MIARDDPSLALAPPLAGETPLRPSVLIVDDQAANVLVLHRSFAQDHQVFMATSGEQAIEVCTRQLPDLVLLDVMMAGMDGYEVCARLKAQESTRDIPIIFVTAHDDEEAESRGLDAGAVDFISKPINPRIVRARAKTHITLKRQADLLRQWAFVDVLTGLYNRRHLDELAHNEWRRAQRQRSALSVILLDVDHFKRFNDLYGHPAGDDCLRRVAVALKACVHRPGDLLARYGGEEFACVLPQTDWAGAMHVAAQMGSAVQALAIPHARSSAGAVVTVSSGLCSTVPGPNASLATLWHEADAHLYRAKAEGRNRACGAELPHA